MTESRQRDAIIAKQVGAPGPNADCANSSTTVSRLEQVKMRVRAKLQGTESKLVDNSNLEMCMGSSSFSSISRFEALRRIIKSKEAMAVGELYVAE